MVTPTPCSPWSAKNRLRWSSPTYGCLLATVTRVCAAIRAEFPQIGIVVLSQYVADAYLSSLLESSIGGIGYLLKDRVGHVTEFLASLDRVADGGTVVDPEVVRQLLARRRDDGPLAALSPRSSPTCPADQPEG